MTFQTKIVPVHQLKGRALDWAATKVNVFWGEHDRMWNEDGTWDILPMSTDWSLGGPVIEANQIDLSYMGYRHWNAMMMDKSDTPTWSRGETALQAAIRAYVQASLGNQVEVPAELDE